jgi:hypothetical protein
MAASVYGRVRLAVLILVLPGSPSNENRFKLYGLWGREFFPAYSAPRKSPFENAINLFSLRGFDVKKTGGALHQ